MINADDDLLCVADTKLVLGNWFAECVMNGRSLPDFAAMLGMCTASYGQTRAIYQHLAPGSAAYAELERGRGPAEIQSMELLDAPPTNWEDLIVTGYLVEQATWALMSTLISADDRSVAALARKVGEEAYFHLKYATGWLQLIGSDEAGTHRLRDALARRFPLAYDWFGSHDAALTARQHGVNTKSELAGDFARTVSDDLGRLGLDDQLPSQWQNPDPASWNPKRRRRRDLPAGLFEIIRFKTPELAH